MLGAFCLESVTQKIKKVIFFHFQKYRQILNEDLVHVRRADMQSIDGYLHINNVGNRDDPVWGHSLITSRKIVDFIKPRPPPPARVDNIQHICAKCKICP